MIKSALGASPLEENLRHLTNDIGGRIPGSPANQEAVAWAESAFRSAGVSDVKLEPATLPVAWSEGSTRLTILSGEPFPIFVRMTTWAQPIAYETTRSIRILEGLRLSPRLVVNSPVEA